MHYYSVTYSDSLSHHGIKGQKWGKKNGPPYPLDAEDHSASEKKAGWRKSLKDRRKKDNLGNYGDSDNEKEYGFKLTEKQKRLLKTGAIIAGTALVTYGAYRVYKSGKAISFIEPTEEAFKKQTLEDSFKNAGPLIHIPGVKEAITNQLDSINNDYQYAADLKITDKSQIEHWSSSPSIDQISKAMNPELSGYLNGKSLADLSLRDKLDIMKNVPAEYTTNCMYCTTAYDMNRRGYKVRANGRIIGGTLEQLPKMYKLKDNAMVYDSKYGNVNKYLKKFSEMDNGARGNMIVQFKGGGAHSMAWEVVDNKLNIIDCQTGFRYGSESEVKKLISKTKGTIKTVRTDNAELIWDDMLLRSLDQLD